MLEATPNTRTFSASDIRDAGSDFLSAAMGAPSVHSHPVADQLRNHELSLAEAAYILGEPEIARRGGTAKTASKVINAGLTTDDFGSILESATARVVAQSYRESAAHRALLWPYPVPNYQPAEVASIDVDADIGEVDEYDSVPSVSVDISGGQTGQLISMAANLVVTYRVVLNDDLEAVAATARAMATSAARREARMLYSWLESNPQMADGSPMFHADFGNLITGVADIQDSAIANAMAALRDQPTPTGQKANHRLDVMLVNANDEFHAKKQLRDAGMDDVDVIASPWLSDSTWYCMAAARTAPTIAGLFLGSRGDTAMQTIKVSRVKADPINRRTGVTVAHDFGFAPISRTGIVKVTN